MKNRDIYKYDGCEKISFDTERFIQYCEKVQKLIYEHNELFEGFENDLIYNKWKEIVLCNSME